MWAAITYQETANFKSSSLKFEKLQSICFYRIIHRFLVAISKQIKSKHCYFRLKLVGENILHLLVAIGLRICMIAFIPRNISNCSRFRQEWCCCKSLGTIVNKKSANFHPDRSRDMVPFLLLSYVQRRRKKLEDSIKTLP